MTDLSSLNMNQLSAALWDRGPLLVLAGPGAGKTRVLTYRIADILQKSDGESFRLLVLTFTNKAVGETRSRLKGLDSRLLRRVRLTTFHSFATELLQQHGSHIGVIPNFQILSDNSDREALLDETLFSLRKNPSHEIPEHFEASALLPFLDDLLERRISPDQVETYLAADQTPNAMALASIYSSYKGYLKRSNTFDGPSLLAETLFLLKSHPVLAAHVRKTYAHVMVDDFQEANYAQYRLLFHLMKPNPANFFAVADDGRNLRQGKGADAQSVQELKKDFSVSIAHLPENYRCPPEIIDLANALIAGNLPRAQSDAPLAGIKPDSAGKIVEMRKFHDLDDEVVWLARQMAQKSKEERNDAAVIAGSNKLLAAVQAKMAEFDVPVHLAARKNDFHSAPFRFLYSVLRLAHSLNDKRALAKLVKSFHELEGSRLSVPKIASRASASFDSFLRTWLSETLRRSELDKDAKEFLLTGMKPLLVSLDYAPVSENLINWAKTKQPILSESDEAFSDFAEEEKAWTQITNDISKKYAGANVGLDQFLHELDIASKPSSYDDGSVSCLNIRATNGMRFKHVYLMGLVEDQLPSWSAAKKGADSLELQEERRNCFASITSAQEKLTLTFSETVFGWSKAPSRFLSEMGFSLGEPV
ncbi:MAG: ATP-dependent helicase [Deltaproteobacteria bacterium]|jgi:DNA helicase-2/ATP-dependent DNA helicase PcrA|nr:ATP-dependent helicase [Deltaproteobacteria bacterium]